MRWTDFRAAILCLLLVCSPVRRVAGQGSPVLPEFEVASVKPVEPNVMHMVGVKIYPGGRTVISTMSLKSLVVIAFRLSFWQVSGGDSWVDKEEFDIEAKPAESSRGSIKDLRYTLFGIEDEHLRGMLQALLIDRFQLKFHRETKTGDVYLLVPSGKELRLRPAETSSGDPSSFGSIGYVGAQWSIYATNMPQLAKYASDHILRAPVLDRTELSGPFDYRQRLPDLEPNYRDPSESFLRFLPEMGFKLERSKGQVEFLVIDHAARPSAN
jgi:uncharacterized protein (TIGR03435 family)